jgi:hypothetical protein
MSMQILTRELLEHLRGGSGPCVSIYIPCDEEISGISYLHRCRDAVSQLTPLLKSTWSEVVEGELLSAIHAALSEEPPSRRVRSIAIFATTGRPPVVVALERAVPMLVVAATSFHVRPLLKIFRGGAQETRSALAAVDSGMRGGFGSDRVATIAVKAVRGEVACLVLEKDIQLWGYFDRSSGRLTLHSRQQDGRDDDVLDDIAEVVMASGGQVLTVASGDMPTASPVAALFNKTA